MPVVNVSDLPSQTFKGGATYQTVVGDDDGSTPIRLGVQTSPPGYRTGTHTHPYMETITVLEGQGEAWIEGSEDIVTLQPGITLILPANHRHWFGASGDKPLVTLGEHASAYRIVKFDDE